MKKLLKYLILTAVGALAPAFAHADIGLQLVGAENIYLSSTEGSGLAATGSLVLLVAHESLTGNFGSLYAGNIAVGAAINPGGVDIVVGQIFISSTPGLLNTADLSFTLTGNWAAGDPLAIYWIPSLSGPTPNVGATIAYGMYTDPTGLGGSEAWITPTDGTVSYPPMFFSDTGTHFPMNVPVDTGLASLSTLPAVPEPATASLLGALLVLGLVFRRSLSPRLGALVRVSQS